MRRFALALLLMTGVGALNAQDFSGRVDVFGQLPMVLKSVEFPQGGSFTNISWGSAEQRVASLTGAKGGLKQGEWTTLVFSFVPSESGTVNVQFKGQWSKSKDKKNIDQVWVYIDNIKVEGAELRNGDFEALDANGNPEKWAMGKNKDANAALIADEKIADGKNCVKVWHNSPVSQNIKVEKDKPVKITFDVKPADFVPASE